MSHTNRIVILVDMDCFFCQVEEKLNPNLTGKPTAVVQYNAWRGGGIIAVNYRARDRGVTRHMRGDEAKKKCPEIELVRVPTVRGKADLTKYRDAGKSVAKVLQTFTPLIERASVDEAYLDITEAVEKRLACTTTDITLSQIRNTHVASGDSMDFLYNLYNGGLYSKSDLKLAFGAVITEEIRAAVYEQTGYTCSAGIAHNKILAKLACGLHKPNKQTVLSQNNVHELYKNLPVQKIRSLGGKFGLALSEDLGVANMGELLKFTERELTKRYDEKTAIWLYNIARGINFDPVTTRLTSKSIGCCKQFAGRAALTNSDSVTHWLTELALELVERLENDLEENNRRAKQIVVNYSQQVDGKNVTSSRTQSLNSYESKKIAADAFQIIKKNCLKADGTFCLKMLGLSAGKFEDCRNVNEITSFFKTGDSNKTNLKENFKKQESGVVKSTIPSFFIKNCQNDVENSDDVNINEERDNYDDELNMNTSNFLNATCTNFSDTTEELDEGSSELAFFNENDTESGNVSDSDSISNELCSTDSSDFNKSECQKKSFFLNYFENLRKHDRKSPILRDFNTSRNLEELDKDCNSEESFSENSLLHPFSTYAAGSKVNIAYNIPGTSRDTFNFEEATETCGECGKKVLKTEMISHTDHHFVLKMVREESELYKNEAVLPPVKESQNNGRPVKIRGKRKLAETKNNATLETFFKTNTEPSDSFCENTKSCPHCNKKVDAPSFESHLDYHVAKKLHMEINPVKSSSPESLKKQITESDGKSKYSKQTKGSVQSVINFFKSAN